MRGDGFFIGMLKSKDGIAIESSNESKTKYQIFSKLIDSLKETMFYFYSS